MSDAEIKKGLAGVTVDYTAVSKVNPETNSLLYRGYPVQELAATQSFEAVALLLWNGDLPTAEELREFEEFERSHRDLDAAVRTTIDLLPLDAHPMDVARTAVSVIGALAPRPTWPTTPWPPTSRRRNCCSRRSPRSSRTTSVAAAARRSSSPAPISTTRATFFG